MATTDYADIRAAFEARLATVPNIPPTSRWAYENQQFDKVVGQRWVQQGMHWADEHLISKPAAGGFLERRGAYRIVLYFPVDRGTPADADALAQAVVDAFPMGLTLVQGATTVLVEAPRRWAGGLGLEEGFYGVPVDVPWVVWRPNPLT